MATTESRNENSKKVCLLSVERGDCPENENGKDGRTLAEVD